jgi:hypothetical protein
VSVYPTFIVARQCFGKQVPAAKNTHATTEKTVGRGVLYADLVALASSDCYKPPELTPYSLSGVA